MQKITIINNRCMRSVWPLFAASFLTLFFSAGSKAQEPQNMTGRIAGRSANNSWHFEMINNLDQHKERYGPMKTAMLRVFSTVAGAPVVSPPKGFVVTPSLAVAGAYDDSHQWYTKDPTQATLSLPCFNYYRDRYTHAIRKGAESHGGLHISANQPKDICDQAFQQDCRDTKTVFFFFACPIDSSRADYWRIRDTRVIKRPGARLFVPLSREEYLGFLVKKANEKLKTYEDNLTDLKNMNTPIASVKKTIRDGIAANESAMEKVRQVIKEYRNTLARMDSAERKAPVYVADYLAGNKFLPGQSDYAYRYQPVARSTAGSKALWKINPAYFDTTRPKTSIQLLVLTWHASNFCPPFLKQRLADWFQQIDYDKLKKLVASPGNAL